MKHGGIGVEKAGKQLDDKYCEVWDEDSYVVHYNRMTLKCCVSISGHLIE